MPTGLSVALDSYCSADALAQLYYNAYRKRLGFMSKEWEENCKNALITLKHTGTESRNSLGFGETCHAMVRRGFNRVPGSYPSEPRELRLSLSVKAENAITSPLGLVPSLLVSGMTPEIVV